MDNKTPTLLGYKLITYDNGDVILYKDSKSIAFGKYLDDLKQYEIYSEAGIHYLGPKRFNSFNEVIKFFQNIEDSIHNEFLYWN
jgi:hypothetical protein